MTFVLGYCVCTRNHWIWKS